MGRNDSNVRFEWEHPHPDKEAWQVAVLDVLAHRDLQGDWHDHIAGHLYVSIGGRVERVVSVEYHQDSVAGPMTREQELAASGEYTEEAVRALIAAKLLCADGKPHRVTRLWDEPDDAGLYAYGCTRCDDYKFRRR